MLNQSINDTDQSLLSALKHLPSLVDILLGSRDGDDGDISSFRWHVDPRLRLLSHLLITIHLAHLCTPVLTWSLSNHYYIHIVSSPLSPYPISMYY